MNYHWQWADTFHGGRNIDVFGGRDHIATVFTEDDAKRIIAALKYNPQAEREKVLDLVIKKFEKEDHDGFANMPRSIEIVRKLKEELRQGKEEQR